MHNDIGSLPHIINKSHQIVSHQKIEVVTKETDGPYYQGVLVLMRIVSVTIYVMLALNQWS